MPRPTELQQTRRDSGPVTKRGEDRKEQLLAAARRVFEEKGYIETRVADIVREAQVSHGTFYTYFDTKEDVFSAVAHRVLDAMMVAMDERVPRVTFSDRVMESVHRFVYAYRPHAVMLGLMEQVGTYSPTMRRLRLEARDQFVQRSARAIRHQQEVGTVDPDLDITYTAEALGAMIEYTCYVWFALKKDFDEDRVLHALSSIWQRALQAPRPD